MKMIDFLILLLFPIFFILILKLEWKINKFLFIDLYIPKFDREKIKEVFKNE